MILISMLEVFFFHGFIFLYETFESSFALYTFLEGKGPSSETVKTEETNCSEREPELALWGLPREPMTYNPHLNNEQSYEKSELTIEQSSFFDQLASEFSFNNDAATSENTKEEVIVFELSKEQEPIQQDHMLSMEDWTDKVEPSVNIADDLTLTADSSIGNLYIGKQKWVVEIIGEEQNFIHVSDGSGRSWVNAGGFGHFRQGDILSLLVDRKTDQIVDLLAAELLQEFSDEFSIYDEVEDEILWSELTTVAQ